MRPHSHPAPTRSLQPDGLDGSLEFNRMFRQLRQIFPDDEDLAAESVANLLRELTRSMSMEQIYSMAKLFVAHDTNGDGVLDAFECERLVSELCAITPSFAAKRVALTSACMLEKRLTFVKFLTHMAQLDTSGKQSTSAVVARGGSCSAAGSRAMDVEGPWRRREAAPFNLADEALSLMSVHARGDGMLGSMELRRAIADFDHKHGRDSQFAQRPLLEVLGLFNRFKNAAGALGLGEMVALLGELHGCHTNSSPTACLPSDGSSSPPPIPGAATVHPHGHHNQACRCTCSTLPAAAAPQTAAPAIAASYVPQTKILSGAMNATASPSSLGSEASTYEEKLLAHAQGSMAVRDALSMLPEGERHLLIDAFRQVDDTNAYQVGLRQFMRLWHLARQKNRQIRSAKSGRFVPVVCILLPAMPNLSESAIEDIFHASDDAGGNMAGQGQLDLNEVACAMFDATEDAFKQLALNAAASRPSGNAAVTAAHTRPDLAEALPVAITLMRGMGPEGDGTLAEEEFVQGMRMLIEAALTLTAPLMTTCSKDRRKLKLVFKQADLNADGVLDANEWLLWLSLQHRMLPALKQWSREPFRNPLVVSLRATLKKNAEKTQLALTSAGGASAAEIGLVREALDGGRGSTASIPSEHARLEQPHEQRKHIANGRPAASTSTIGRASTTSVSPDRSASAAVDARVNDLVMRVEAERKRKKKRRSKKDGNGRRNTHAVEDIVTTHVRESMQRHSLA
eukprot:CAMPEP_0115834034 /NCGR_PEP_ID=MMETSP0287-20121206/3478_1 /TAXON_ID=412157 /ORGANISM="Chrysochromulina rotalis, Strain UIO044" /LENGTH=739 /DNA_ID=CAMNT_0003287463 /DNA_START=117 /DNA_END=2336 /DNA_ORIENTATION=-